MKNIEYIFVFTSPEEYPTAAVSLATQLAGKAEKPVCFLSYTGKKLPYDKEKTSSVLDGWAKSLTPKVEKGAEYHVLSSIEDFHSFITDAEASTVVFQLSEHAGFNKVKTFLKITREIRIPYIFTKPYFAEVDLSKILVPVTFLVEDNEKGRFASNFGQYFGAKVQLMTATDYGHKAAITTGKIRTLLERVKVPYEEVEANGNSFKVELEAVHRAKELGSGVVICSASREYGLDDIIFGPKELNFINDTDVPLILLNPRADLYVLCG